MGVETITLDRLTQSDGLTAEALNNAESFVEAFKSLEKAKAPLFIPGTPDYLPSTPVPSNLPAYPSQADVANAEAIIGEIDEEIDNLEQQVRLEVNTALDEFTSELASIESKIATLRTLADNIVIPTASDFIFTEGDYRVGNDLDAILKLVIEDEIAKNGEGYSQDTEDNLYDRDRERREFELQEAVDAALDEHAPRGFTMPQGFHMAAIMAANDKFRSDDRGLSKDIMIAQSKLSLDNKWRAIEAGISYNQIKIALADSMAQRALDAAAAIFTLNLDSIKFRLGVAMKIAGIGQMQIGAIVDDKRNSIEIYTADLLRIGKKLDGLITQAKGYLMAYRTDGHLYATGINASEATSKLAQGHNVLSLKVQQGTLLAGMSSARNALRSFIETSKIRLESAAGQAAIHQANAESALRGLDTVIQMFKSGETTTADTP